jgi:hypothetical protein
MESQNRKAKTVVLLSALGLTVAAFIVFLLLMRWGRHIPKRPANISSRGVFLEVGSVPFKLSTHGDWLECWKDKAAILDRCKYTDERGTVYFEDFVLPYEGISPVPEQELIIDTVRTSSFHYGVTENNLRFPLIVLRNGQILLPQTDYEWGRQNVDYWITRKTDKPPSR